MVIIYLHGGGFMSGEEEIEYARQLAWAFSTPVVSVGYRMAPENLFPVPINDCVDAVHWVLTANTAEIR